MSRSYVPRAFSASQIRPWKVGDYRFGKILTQADIDAETPPKRIEPQPIELTPGQTIALLTLRKSQLARAILQKLAHSTARAGYQNKIDLIHFGFAEGDGNGDYRITYPGQVHANILARKLAVELGINPHLFDVKRERSPYNPGIYSPYNPW